ALASGDPARAARLLEGSLALWRGHVLEDVLIDAESESFMTRLEESRNTAEEAWVDARLTLGDNTDLADLIGRVRLLIEEQPLREHSW
ncbi:BTAD domain-containing putative transcriptional regulator, partial [Escherichia coli]